MRKPATATRLSGTLRTSRKGAVALFATSLLASPAFGTPPSTIEKGYDALVLRPLGLVQVVTGAAAYALFYAPAAAAGFTTELSEFCLAAPLYQTFERPLGEMAQHRRSTGILADKGETAVD
jgi:hypothetical protein